MKYKHKLLEAGEKTELVSLENQIHLRHQASYILLLLVLSCSIYPAPLFPFPSPFLRSPPSSFSLLLSPTSRWATVTTSPLRPPASSLLLSLFRLQSSAAGPAFALRLVHCSKQVTPSISTATLPATSYFSFSRAYSSKKKKNKKMPPKKNVVQEKVLLGRPGNNLKSGIVCEHDPSCLLLLNFFFILLTSLQVGLANVGKSTLFQAITKSTLGNPANFPYATIDPEEARVIVPDARFDWLCEHYKPKSQVPANLTVYDIAGLTRGASTGAGLGNAFLSHIRAVDAIFQVVRCFDDAEIIHVEGDVDPVRDLTIINEELRIKDIEFVTKALENLQKQTRRGGQTLEMKKLREEEATVAKILQWLQNGHDVRHGDWNPKEVCMHFSLFLFQACLFA